MGTGGDLRGRGDHRDQYEEAKRIQPDDHRLQAGRDRPHPDKISLPLRPEHRRLPGDGADAEGQGDRGHLRKGKYQYADRVQRVPHHSVQRICPGRE